MASASYTVVPSHPWLTFHFDANSLSADVWILLGECSSKIEHISGAPLLPATQRHLNRVFLAKGAHATTAIEGNTLSEDQVLRRLAGDLELPKSQEYLGQEVDNIIRGYGWLEQRIRDGALTDLTPRDLKHLNGLVLSGLELPEGVIPGEFRQYVVGVGDYRSPEPRYTADLVSGLCQWLNAPSWNQGFGTRFVLSIIKAILAHLYIAWIHPFGDGNGRTARLVEFDILVRAGVPTDSGHMLSNHYNATRSAYYQALTRARSNPAHFVEYAVQGFADGLREQIDVVERQQLRVAWRDFVYQAFEGEPRSPARDRRRTLVFELTKKAMSVRRRDLPGLSPELATAYAGKTDKTISRDVNALCSMQLVRKTPEGIVANTEVMRAFLPLVNMVPVEGPVAPLPEVPELPFDSAGAAEGPRTDPRAAPEPAESGETK